MDWGLWGGAWQGRPQCCLRFLRCVSAVLYLFKWFSASGKRLLSSAPPCCSSLPVFLPMPSSLAPCKCLSVCRGLTFKTSCSVMLNQASLLAWVSTCSNLQIVGMVEPEGFMLGINTTYVKFRACLVLHTCYQLSSLLHCTSVFSGGGRSGDGLSSHVVHREPHSGHPEGEMASLHFHASFRQTEGHHALCT